MPNSFTTEGVLDALKRHHFKIRPVALELNMCRKTVAKILNAMPQLDYGPPIPDEERSVEQLLDARIAEYARKEAHGQATAVRRVKVNIDGPVGIAHFGDPHIDDPGTDIALLKHHMDLVKNTRGMYAANVGDLQNNWVGRLSALYAHSTVTARESWKLVEWMLNYLKDPETVQSKWLYVVGGNHDVWSGDRDIVEWFAANGGIPYQYHGVRMALEFPNGREVKVNTRHDFKGNSMWNVAHAAMRAAQVSFKDNIFTCGHRHVSGYGIVVNPDTENPVISHCLRVSAYKKYDDFASKIGATPHDISPCAVTIIDPEAAHERDLVTVIWSPDNAADYLTWVRLKRGADIKGAKSKKPNRSGEPLEATERRHTAEYELEEYNLNVKASNGRPARPTKAIPKYKATSKTPRKHLGI